MRWLERLWNALGILFGLLCGVLYAKFNRDLHESVLYFSHIKEIERLISLRTESGFYYSFYQQLVNAKSLNNGFALLLNDTKSEFPHSINALQRFNIYPEVLFALIYRFLPYKFSTPIFFYADICFFFSGLATSAAYFLSWVFSGEWIFGLIVGTWMLVNFEDSGRTNFVLNLRENFALPFLWLQFIFVIRALRNPRLFDFIAIAILSFLFSTCWQFSQFVLLLQSCALIIVCLLKPQHESNVRKILFSQTCGFFLTIILHFFQPMLLTAPVIWLNFSLILCTTFIIKNDAFNFKNALLTGLLIVLVFVCSLSLAKLTLNVQSDTHIWTFFLAKFGIILSEEEGIPFETTLYLHHPGFTFMGWDFIERTQKSGILQLYVLVIVLFVLFSLFNFLKHYELPKSDQLFVIVKSLFFAVMAYTTMRMKYVFLPQMAVVSASFFGFMDRFVGRYFKYVVIFGVVTKLSMDQYAFYKKVLSREQVIF